MGDGFVHMAMVTLVQTPNMKQVRVFIMLELISNTSESEDIDARSFQITPEATANF